MREKPQVVFPCHPHPRDFFYFGSLATSHFSQEVFHLFVPFSPNGKRLTAAQVALPCMLPQSFWPWNNFQLAMIYLAGQRLLYTEMQFLPHTRSSLLWQLQVSSTICCILCPFLQYFIQLIALLLSITAQKGLEPFSLYIFNQFNC